MCRTTGAAASMDCRASRALPVSQSLASNSSVLVMAVASRRCRAAHQPVVRCPILGCQPLVVGTSRTANDSPVVVAGFAGGRLPGSVVDHRTLDREHATVVVGHNQVERLAGIALGMRQCHY